MAHFTRVRAKTAESVTRLLWKSVLLRDISLTLRGWFILLPDTKIGLCRALSAAIRARMPAAVTAASIVRPGNNTRELVPAHTRFPGTFYRKLWARIFVSVRGLADTTPRYTACLPRVLSIFARKWRL